MGSIPIAPSKAHHSLRSSVSCLAAAESDWLRHKRIVLAALEFVGQFINTGTSSHQFGYIARINGLDQVFNNATTKNESTAMFTFFIEGTTVHVFVNGPLKIVERTGTTTVYYNPMQPRSARSSEFCPRPCLLQLNGWAYPGLLHGGRQRPLGLRYCARLFGRK